MVQGPLLRDFISALQRCRQRKDPFQAKLLYASLREWNLEQDHVLGNHVVPLLVDCGRLPEAQRLFQRLPSRNEHSWTSLISGYVDSGNQQQAFNLYHSMRQDQVCPNSYTIVALLKSCSGGLHGDCTRTLHSEIIVMGMDADSFIGNTLVDLYGQVHSLEEAQHVFDHLHHRNTVSWNALISAYAECDFCEEVLDLFEQMQMQGVAPAPVTFACSLKACGGTAALETGKRVHTEAAKRGLEMQLFIGNSLMYMYGKCGSLLEAQLVFEELPDRDVVSWTAIIHGYGENHKNDKAVQYFERMQDEGVKPNDVTFMCILAACSHGSLLLKGKVFFEIMMQQHNIEPMVNHYACMVDLFARSGLISEAVKLLWTMEGVPSEDTVKTMLTACKIHGELELAEKCFQMLVEVNDEDAAPYMLMVETYANAGRWEDACKLDEIRKDIGAKKSLAFASIQVNSKVHEFVVRNHQSKYASTPIFEYLDARLKDQGYVPNLDIVVHSSSH